MPRIETQFDYYAILGVSSTATLDEIKKGYRVRAIEVHPDKNQGNPNATSAFQRVSLQYHFQFYLMTLADTSLTEFR